MHADTRPFTVVLIGLALAAAFLVGVFLHTPPQACAEDPSCARAPVSNR